MENRMKKVGKVSSFLTKYIGVIIICFSVIAFFWRDGFAWTTSYTSVFLGVAMFGMGLTIKMDDFKRVFSRPKEILIGFIAQYTIMPVIAWILCQVDAAADRSGTWRDPGWLLPGWNGKQCDHLYCRR